MPAMAPRMLWAPTASAFISVCASRLSLFRARSSTLSARSSPFRAFTSAVAFRAGARPGSSVSPCVRAPGVRRWFFGLGRPFLPVALYAPLGWFSYRACGRFARESASRAAITPRGFGQSAQQSLPLARFVRNQVAIPSSKSSHRRPPTRCEPIPLVPRRRRLPGASSPPERARGQEAGSAPGRTSGRSSRVRAESAGPTSHLPGRRAGGGRMANPADW